MITTETILSFLNKILADTDIFIVDVQVRPGNKIYIYIDSPANVSIDDCVFVNRMFNEQFDRETEDYALEVSSPGLSAPLKVPQQYLKNLGKEVKVKTNEGMIIKGKLTAFENNSIIVLENRKIKGKVQTTEHNLNLNDLTETRLEINFLNNKNHK